MNAQKLFRRMPTAARALLFAALLAMDAGPSNADTWEIAPPMPTPRSALAATSSTDGSKIYTLGVSGAAGVSNAVEVFDAPARTWRTVAPMPTARERRLGAASREVSQRAMVPSVI